MPVYIARLRDGSCLIAEAQDEESLRTRFAQGEDLCHGESDEIVAVRSLPSNTFMSRWWMNEDPSESESFVGRLDGGLDHDFQWDIFTHELPMLAAAHSRADIEEPLVPKDLPGNTPVLDPRVMKQMEKWSKNLGKRLMQAVELEKERFRRNLPK